MGSTHRWVRIVGALLMNLALGSLYAWSVFVGPLEKEFGWTRAQTSLVFTIDVVVFSLTLVLAGRLQDRYGPFKVSLMGAILWSLAFSLAAHTTSLHYLMLCFGLISGLATGFGYATPIPVLAKWFPDRRGVAVGLAIGGYGAGSAVFGPLVQIFLLPAYGWRTTFRILGATFFLMTTVAAFLLRNPPQGYAPPGWKPAPHAKARATTYQFTPGGVLRTPAFYFMWAAYALGCSSGLMVISQLVPFARSAGISSAALQSMGLVVGAAGNAAGRILSGWMSDSMGRLNTLRLMIGISMVAMPLLYLAGGNVALFYLLVFVVYWCYGTQLSVNASAASDFWGTTHAGINYALLFTGCGIAGIVGPRIGGVMFDRYQNYQAAFYIAGVLAAGALVCELLARRPEAPAVTAVALDHVP